MIQLLLACDEDLGVLRFSVRESVSSMFTVKVVASSPDPCVDFGAILGQRAALRVTSAQGSGLHGERCWSGICNQVRQLHALDLKSGEAGLSTYELTLVPRLWLLTQRTNHRVFQHLSSHELARKLLDEWTIDATWHIDASDHPRFAYKIQYGETDFDFLSRTLEEAGIAYAFIDGGEEGNEDTQLVLSDALHLSAPRGQMPVTYLDRPSASTERELITEVILDRQLRTDAVVFRDHDFLRPTWSLLGQARSATSADSRSERYIYRPGSFAVERDGVNGSTASGHDDRYAARLAARTLEAERTGHCSISFHTNTLDLRPGTVFSAVGHPRPELDPNTGILVTALAIDGGPRGDWTLQGSAVSASEPYRPARRTPKPNVHGVQSAVVVGPADQEIHTDEHGRVRVQFPWDRDGARDEQSSCWLRVGQGWAGAGYGIFTLPRIGQEVLVAFLAGDPDQPILVGCVSNALNPLPLKLPDDKTQSVWRSSSSPGGEGFNELRFEDRKGGERVSLRAERELRTDVGRDEELAVRRNRTKAVGGDESARTEGRLVTYVGRNAHLTIESELRERIGGKRSLTVEGDQHQHIGGAAALEAGGTLHLKAGTAIVIEASDLTLRGPGGFVRIDASGVTIDGTAVKIQQGGAPGRAPGASPALPVLPAGVALRPRPERLPLLGFASGLPVMQAGGLGGGGPLTPEDAVVCGFICECKEQQAPQRCVTKNIRALEDASAQTSTIRAEVPYDLSKDPPEPIISKNDPRRPTRGWPSGSRIPDVVIVKDGTKPPTQDNMKEVIEIKFPPDKLDKEQRESYETIAGRVPFKVLGPDKCGCPGQDKQERQDVTVADVAEAAVLTLLILAAALDDVVPGGQIDDAAIPPAVARILSLIGPLLR